METEVNGEVVEVANDTTDYKALYEEKTNKVTELEWLIQKHKDKKVAKTETKTEVINEQFNPDMLEKMLNEREFYKNNPWMVDYKDQISEFTSTGKVSLEQAQKLVIDSNPDIVARQNTKNSNFTDWISWGSKKSYSQEQLQKLPHAEKMQVLRDIDAGKSIETN